MFSHSSPRKCITKRLKKIISCSKNDILLLNTRKSILSFWICVSSIYNSMNYPHFEQFISISLVLNLSYLSRNDCYQVWSNNILNSFIIWSVTNLNCKWAKIVLTDWILIGHHKKSINSEVLDNNPKYLMKDSGSQPLEIFGFLGKGSWIINVPVFLLTHSIQTADEKYNNCNKKKF